MDLVVIARTYCRQPTHLSIKSNISPRNKNSPSSIPTLIVLPTAQVKLLSHKRIAVNIADSPVQDALIRARAQDQFRRLGRPVLVSLGDAQAVADADDVAGPGAAGHVAGCAFDFEGAGGGLGAVDVGEPEGLGAVVDDDLGGYGVRGAGEG